MPSLLYNKTPNDPKTQAIGEMVEMWVSDKKPNSEGKYLCPHCNNIGFSRNKREPYRYSCYKCKDEPNVLKSLIELFGQDNELFHPKKKTVRPKQKRSWIYLDRQGQFLIKVTRTDDGNGKRSFNQYHWNGKQWISGYGPVNREDIPIYRYQEITEAIAQNKTIFIVEGEPCADLLWKMGIPATCNIGGSGKWLPHHSKDLESAKVVICPDRDTKGIDHAETIAKAFPNAQWFYALPDSPVWQNLPDKDGLDIADWVADYKLSKDDILAAVGPKRKTAAHNQTGNTVGGNGNQGKNNVVNHPRYNPDPIDHDELMDRIDQLIGDNLGETTTLIELTNLAKEFGVFVPDLKKIYSDRLKQLEQIEDREDTKKQVDYFLKTEHSDIDLRQYIPQEMADPLTWIADVLGSNPLSMLTILLSVVASLTNPDTKLELIKSTGFYAKPILYTGIVAESGSAKSPTMKTIISPFKKLQNEADARYKEQLEEYQEDLRAWKATKKDARGVEPIEPPPPREYFSNDATAEAISLIQSNQPDKGLLMEFDELSGLIKSANAYRGGKGTDAEKILSGRDGTGIKVNRASGKRLSNPRSTFSITGGIQRDVLKQQMGNLKDSQGHWARFLWAVMPIREAKFPDDEPPIYINSILEDLYRKIEALPAIDYKLSESARKIYADWFLLLEKSKMDEPNQALRAAYAKMKQFVGDIALLLQTIENAFYGELESDVSERIMRIARNLSAVYLRQIKLIYGEAEVDGNLSPILKKIIELSNRKGQITARDAIRGVWKLKGASSDQVREHFKELVEMDYGEIIGSGRRLAFISNGYKSVDERRGNVDESSTITPNSKNPIDTTSQASGIKSVDERVDEMSMRCRGTENLTDSDSQPIKSQSVEDLEQKTQPPKKTNHPNKKSETINNASTTSTRHKPFDESQLGKDLQNVDESSTVDRQSSTSSTLSYQGFKIGDRLSGKYRHPLDGGLVTVKGVVRSFTPTNGEPFLLLLDFESEYTFPLSMLIELAHLSWEERQS